MEQNEPFIKDIKLKKWQKALVGFGIVLLLIGFIVYQLVSSINNSNTDTLFDELNISYTQSSLLTDVYGASDFESMKTKLLSAGFNFNTSGKLEEVSADFQMTQDATLSEKEFCALFNSYAEADNETEDFSLKQMSIVVNNNNAILELKYVIKQEFLAGFNIKKQSLSQDVTLITNVYKYVNSNRTISINTIGVNGFTELTAKENVRSTFFGKNSIDVFDLFITSFCEDFNCDYVFENGLIKIIA